MDINQYSEAESYDIYEDKRTFEHTGITGDVRNELIEQVSYPYLLIENTEDKPVLMSTLQVLPNLFGTSQVGKATDTTDDSLQPSPVSIYYRDKGKTMKLGKLPSRQIRAFLRLFRDNEVTGMYDASTKLSGYHLYVLAE